MDPTISSGCERQIQRYLKRRRFHHLGVVRLGNEKFCRCPEASRMAARASLFLTPSLWPLVARPPVNICQRSGSSGAETPHAPDSFGARPDVVNAASRRAVQEAPS